MTLLFSPLFIMKAFDFLDPLEEIIVEQFEVLDDSYARDMASDILGTLVGTIENENVIRYLLIDGETGQLESRTLYTEFIEAENAAREERHGKSCQVATLILEQ
jgi:hypothetical protein